MIIGIVSDTHNHIENTRKALSIFQERGVERIIHCGDITTPPVVELFVGWQVTFVFGNIDHDHADLMAAAKQISGIGSMGYHFTAVLGGTSIAVCHGDDEDLLARFIGDGNYQIVFHGHTHQRRDEKIGRTRVINPGALGGRVKESRSVCVLDLDTGAAEFVVVEEAP